MSGWKRALAMRDDPRTLAQMLNDAMQVRVEDRNVEEYYDACEIQCHIGHLPVPAEADERTVESIRSQNPDAEEDELERLALMQNAKLAAFSVEPENKLPPLGAKPTNANVLDLAIFLERFERDCIGKSIQLLERVIHQHEVDEPLLHPATASREEMGIADMNVEQNGCDLLAKNLASLRSAIVLLTDQQAAPSHAERLNAMRNLSKGQAIVQQVIDKLAQQLKVEKVQPITNIRSGGMHKALMELQKALAPAISKAQGELKAQS